MEHTHDELIIRRSYQDVTVVPATRSGNPRQAGPPPRSTRRCVRSIRCGGWDEGDRVAATRDRPRVSLVSRMVAAWGLRSGRSATRPRRMSQTVDNPGPRRRLAGLAARMMTAGELMSCGYDIVSVPYSRRLKFNNALDILFDRDDATELLQFLSTCTLTD